MNIPFLNVVNSCVSPSFNGRPKKIVGKILQELAQDTVELSTKKENMLPRKFEFTEIEAEFNEILLQRNALCRDIRTQKENLYSYYSAQDKADCKELVKEKRKVENKLKRIAKKYNVNESDIEHRIYEKKEYNRYAPKIYNAKTAQDLDNLQELVLSERFFYYSSKKLLCQLIAQRKASLK